MKKEGRASFLSAYMLFRSREIELLRREELIQRKFDAVKDFARVIFGRGNALLVRVAEIKGRNQKLDKAYKFNNGEYAKCKNNSLLRAVYYRTYLTRFFIISAVSFMHPFNAGIKNQRFCDLYLDNREIILFYQTAASIVAPLAADWRCTVWIDNRITVFENHTKPTFGEELTMFPATSL